jgi:hypothetical protein
VSASQRRLSRHTRSGRTARARPRLRLADAPAGSGRARLDWHAADYPAEIEAGLPQGQCASPEIRQKQGAGPADIHGPARRGRRPPRARFRSDASARVPVRGVTAGDDERARTRASSRYRFRVKAVAPASRRWADRTHDTTSGFRSRVVSNDGRDAPWPRVPATEGVERKGDRRQFIAHIRPGFAA